MILKEAKQKVELTYQHLIEYAEARWNIIALDVSDKGATIATSVVSGIILGVIAVFFLIFASISLGLWLGSLTDSLALGFLIVAVVYAIVGAVMYLNRKNWLFIPILNKFLQTLYRNQDDKLV